MLPSFATRFLTKIDKTELKNINLLHVLKSSKKLDCYKLMSD